MLTFSLTNNKKKWKINYPFYKYKSENKIKNVFYINKL